MSTNLDWLSVIKRQGPNTPAWYREFISKSDQVFSRKGTTTSIAEEFEALNSELSLTLYDFLFLSLRAHAAVLSRELVSALHSDQTLEHCFTLFENLSRAGFTSPVEKSRIVVILLQYLEGKLTPFELKPLVEAIANELETCRIGCEENLSVLQTFVKAHSDDPTQRETTREKGDESEKENQSD